MVRLNPFSAQARGERNFANCQLKQANTKVTSGSGVNSGPLRVVATLQQCPVLEDQGSGPIRIENTNIVTENPNRASRNAQEQLKRFCGGSICGDCVYVGMESPVQVNLQRVEEANSELAVIEAQQAVLEARNQLEAMEAASALPLRQEV